MFGWSSRPISRISRRKRRDGVGADEVLARNELQRHHSAHQPMAGRVHLAHRTSPRRSRMT